MTFALPTAGTWARWLCAFALILFALPAFATGFSVTSGLSAHWFNPDRSGEGLVLEVLDDEAALLYWFTYDEAGNPRWLIDVGEIHGSEIVFSELLVTRGGRFGPGFNPDEVEHEVAGEAILSFSDCNQGEFSYSAFGQSETLPITRLSQTMAAGCQPAHGVPGQPTREYAGQSGSWYDPAYNGQGYTLQWMSRDEALLVWFSYDSAGDPYWMIGTGTYDDSKIEFPMLQSASGARFGSAFNPEDVNLIDWGRLTLELDCQGGVAKFDSTLPEFGAGRLELDRLTALLQPACPWVQPKLADLYDIHWNEIPNEEAQVQAWSIANDGTVAGWGPSGDGGLALWRPVTGEWQFVESDQEIYNYNLLISPDGTTVVAGKRTRGASSEHPLIWREEAGWEPLPGLIFEHSSLTGTSQDFSRFTGYGRYVDNDRPFPWVWDATHGQQELPLMEEHRPATPIAVSNDGSTVIGSIMRPPMPTLPNVPVKAVLWKADGELEILRDPLGFALGAKETVKCNHDCSLVFGSGQAEQDSEHPFFRQAWFLSDSGQFDYLGEMGMTAVTSDGTLIIGDHLNSNESQRAVIWTQDTGMTTVLSLIEALGIGDDPWLDLSPVGISADGSKILLQGPQGDPGWRIVVLELELKE